MPGMFDDLIPATAPPAQGMFDDLIPQAGAGHDKGALAAFAAGGIHDIPIAGPVLEAGLSRAAALSRSLRHGTPYADELKNVQEDVGKTTGEHPIATAAGGVTGNVAAMAPLGATSVGARLMGLTGGSLLGRSAMAGVGGAGLAGADAAVKGENVPKAMLEGGAFSALGPSAGRVIGKTVEGVRNVLSPKVVLPTAEAIGDAAEHGFDAVRNSGVQLKPSAVAGIAQNTEQELLRDGLRPALAPKTFSLLSELQNPPSGSVATFSDLHSMRRVLGKVAASPDATERMAATRMISELDGYLGNIPKSDVLAGDAQAASQTFKDALGNYAAMKRADTVAGKVEAATDQAASANSGANLENALRQRIRDIIKSPALRRGYSPEELVAMQSVVRGTAPGNVIRTIGNLLGGGGGLGAVAAGTSAALAGAGPAAIAVPIAGYGVKKIGNALTAGRVRALDEAIRSRAPASQAAVAQQALADAATRARLQRAENAGNLIGRAAAPAFGSLAPAYP